MYNWQSDSQVTCETSSPSAQQLSCLSTFSLIAKFCKQAATAAGAPLQTFFASSVILANTLTDVTGDEEDGAGGQLVFPAAKN